MKKKMFIVALMILPYSLLAQSVRTESRRIGTQNKNEVIKKERNPKYNNASSKTKSNVINVSSEEQFLNALGSNRTLIIRKSINLSSIIDYELKLSQYKNLTIKGENPSIRLGVSKGENLVLSFLSCENITISNLVLGHEDVLWCGAGVLYFSNCKGVNITNCDIYGCGYHGIVLSETKDILCSNNVIHNCHVYLLWLADVENAKFVNTIFKESNMGTLLRVYNSKQVLFENCSFIDDTHKGKEMYGHKCFSLTNNITLKKCSIHYTNDYGDINYIIDDGCRWY